MITRLLLVVLSLTLSLPAFAEEKKLPLGVTAHTEVAYVEGGHGRQVLDVFLPPNAAEKCPLIVWIHGGAWVGGDKRGTPALGLAAKGWVVASLNYRFSNHAVFPAQIEDCKSALRFLRANAAKYRIDPERVGVWGASAGGHLVALLGATGHTREFDKGAHLDQSSSVSCVVNYFGPSDFLRWGDTSRIKAEDPANVIAKLFGGPVPEKAELARKASPALWVTKGAAPMMSLHGDKDDIVPLGQSQILDEALRKAGVESVLKVFPEHGHGGPMFQSPETLAEIVTFLEKHTKPAAK